MTPSEIVTRARWLTKTSSTDGTAADTDLLPILNDYYSRQIIDFVNTNEDLFGVKSTTSLNVVSNQEAYALPSDLIRVKRVEITYDGTNWFKIHTNDDGQVQWTALDANSINTQFNQSDPYADIFGSALYLRPIPTAAVSGGLRIWYIQRPSQLSTMSSSVLTPSDYHGYLIYGVAGEIATRKGDQAMAAQMFQKWEDGRNKIKETFAPRNLDLLVDFNPLPTRYT